LFRKRVAFWQNVSEFETASAPPHRLTTRVVYDNLKLSGRPTAKLAAAIGFRTSFLPDTYGLPAAALADLMTRWRERAIDAGRR
jgi:hypothetical protein